MKLEEKLTDEQKKLIENNYKEVYKLLRYRLARESSRWQPEEALSHIMVPARRYDKTKSLSFSNYASDICYKELIDEYREFHRTYLKNPMEKITISEIEKILFIENTDIQEIDWIDFKDRILSEIDAFFINYPDSPKKNRISQGYRSLIKDYLIPMSEGDKAATLKRISENIGIKQSRLCQMVKSRMMRKFIKSCT